MTWQSAIKYHFILSITSIHDLLNGTLLHLSTSCLCCGLSQRLFEIFKSYGVSCLPYCVNSSIFHFLILCRLSFVVCRLSFVVCRLLFVVCRLSFVVCHLSFVICHLSLFVLSLSFYFALPLSSVLYLGACLVPSPLCFGIMCPNM